MKIVNPAPESSNGQEEPASGTLGRALSSEMFEPIRGIDPDFGHPAPLSPKSHSWWSWLHTGKPGS